MNPVQQKEEDRDVDWRLDYVDYYAHIGVNLSGVTAIYNNEPEGIESKDHQGNVEKPYDDDPRKSNILLEEKASEKETSHHL